MIGTLRKHSTWLWVMVIIAVVIGLVVTFNPGARDQGRATGNFGTINGHSVSQADYAAANNEAQLRYFVSTHQWPDRAGKQSNFDLEKETYQQLFLMQKIEEFHLTVDSDSMGMMARNILQEMDQGKPMSLAAFEEQILRPHHLTLNDFQRFLHDYMATLQLVTLVGASGTLMTPQEAQMLYVRENEEVSAQAAIFNATNYLSGVTNTPELIGQFYTNQLANYRLPERVQVSYVEFLLTNFWKDAVAELAKETNFDQRLDEYVTGLGTNFPAGAHNTAEAKVIVRENEIRQRFALPMATEAANKFATALFTNKNPEAIFTLAKLNGLDAKVTEPFGLEQGPKEFSLPVDFAKDAFSLSTEDPFGGPIAGDDGVYVMAWNKRLPSEIPSFESIHAQVVADYQRLESTQLARQATLSFYSEATNALAAGKSFSAACTEAHVKMVPLPTFALSTPALPDIEKLVNLTTLKQAVFSVLPGHLNLAATEDGGIVVFVGSRLPIDQAKLNADLPRYLQNLRQARQQDAFQMWFGREYGRVMAENPNLQNKTR